MTSVIEPDLSSPDGTDGESTDPWHRSPAVDDRVEALLSGMTPAEKIELVTGDINVDYGFYKAPLARLGIPALTMCDGPSGVRINKRSVNGGRATALPAPIALAATWDPVLAARYGDVLGAEAFATGHNVFLGPAVDIARVPVGGRTFESFGEDPLLQARLAAPVIRGIQSHPVQATIKHYAVNNQEHHRATVDAEVDERTLREIYLPPFEAAVRNGDVAAVMGAFNKVNGDFACENRLLLTDLLRRQFGFRGWVMSDYGANHSTAESANAGLDQEQPGAGHWGQQLRQALDDGRVSPATLDEMVRRILRPTVGLGLLEHPVEIGPLPEDHSRVSREIAEAGIVLLKNDGGLLPLAGDTVRSIAVIGPDADEAVFGGGSGLVNPVHTVSPLDGIRRRAAAGTIVEYLPGTDPLSAGALLPGPDPVPSSILTPEGGDGSELGLHAEYWTNTGFTGDPHLVRTDLQVDLNLGFFNFPGFNAASAKLPEIPTELTGQMSARWTGTLTAPADGDYELSLTWLGTARLYVDDQLLIGLAASAQDIAAPTASPTSLYPYGQLVLQGAASEPETVTATVRLLADRPRPIRIEYAADSPEQGFLTGAQIRFGWRPPNGVRSPSVTAAAALAARCDTAVVVVRAYESEHADRPGLHLPNGQDELVRAVGEANPRTVVVLTTGGPVDMTNWHDRPAALLQAWYAGQEQGSAIAAVVFGDVNPSGKLPLTFPRSLAESPIRTAEQYPGVDGTVRYTEGILVGYRGYDVLQLDPLYPFGHGLSYTAFAYDDLTISSPDPSDGTVAVSFVVRNTGERTGTEVAQLYLGTLPGEVPTPPRQLAGFAQVTLDPGQSQRVTLSVARRSMSYWHVAAGGWVTPPGPVAIEVGTSSRDIRLVTTIVVPATGQ
ncbi:beta-glucosidase [Streptomyces diastatochromogenes]|uniref:beta-glucosidase n=1 Tax=Streptomyces diastatochromogenes TaxID=42236 RepID=UPI00367AE04E